MIIWLFACMAGMISHVANYAHGAGLVTGILWGFWDARSRAGRDAN
jgi:membrane associated rhomboid family serine protease